MCDAAEKTKGREVQFTMSSLSQGWHIKANNVFTLTIRGNLESAINQHVFGLWGEDAVQGGNPHKHRERMQTPEGLNPQHCCEATGFTEAF